MNLHICILGYAKTYVGSTVIKVWRSTDCLGKFISVNCCIVKYKITC